MVAAQRDLFFGVFFAVFFVGEKCSQPPGSSVSRLPSGETSVISGWPARLFVSVPIRVTGTPAMELGIRIEAGAVNSNS
jgi:hypothetical protein